MPLLSGNCYAKCTGSMVCHRLCLASICYQARSSGSSYKSCWRTARSQIYKALHLLSAFVHRSANFHVQSELSIANLLCSHSFILTSIDFYCFKSIIVVSFCGQFSKKMPAIQNVYHARGYPQLHERSALLRSG